MTDNRYLGGVHGESIRQEKPQNYNQSIGIR
jgi:hypothetical protein